MRVPIISLLIVCFSWTGALWAQWDEYPTYEGYISMMEKFETDYPQLCKIIEIGESVRERKLLVAKISDNAGTHEKEPGFFYHAALHGNETLGYMLMLRMIDHLLSQYGTDTSVTTLVNNIQIYIDPLVNPDGTYKAGNNSIEGAVRYNANGSDLNRNFPGIPTTSVSPAPEKENMALMDFAVQYPFILSADLHSGVEMIIYPSTVFENCSTACVDNNWFNYVSTEYSLSVSDASTGNCSLQVVPDSTIYGIVNGNWNYYTLHHLHSRSITLELSAQKVMPASQLMQYWDYNHKALLRYIEWAMFGVQGTVTDTMTGEPLNAKVFIENHDKDSSFVYSRLPHGDYYRPVYEGTYDITYSCDGYYPKTVTGIQVQNNNATVVDVKLSNSTGISKSPERKIDKISVKNHNGRTIIQFDVKTDAGFSASIFDVSGTLIKRLDTGAGVGKGNFVWNGLDKNGNPISKGCYFLHVTCADDSIVKRFIVLK